MKPTTRPRLARIALYCVILIALGLVSTVAFVLATDDDSIDAGSVFDSRVIVDPEQRPKFEFEDELRTADISLNRFIDRFFRICESGQYEEFRLMFRSRGGKQILPKRFESMFHALKEARILDIRKLPQLPDYEGPVYLLTAEYDLKNHALKTQKTGNRVRLAVDKEEGSWRIGPIPREAMDRLKAFEAGQNAEQNGDTSEANQPRRIIPNQPARIDTP